jgi:hypothetical protein
MVPFYIVFQRGSGLAALRQAVVEFCSLIAWSWPTVSCRLVWRTTGADGVDKQARTHYESVSAASAASTVARVSGRLRADKVARRGHQELAPTRRGGGRNAATTVVWVVAHQRGEARDNHTVAEQDRVSPR